MGLPRIGLRPMTTACLLANAIFGTAARAARDRTRDQPDRSHPRRGPGGYFYYCATVEEKDLLATFPTAYPAYRASTKMLIPFVL